MRHGGGAAWSVAVIGAGAIARDHCDAIAATPDLRLVRVVDRHPERARTLAALYGADAGDDAPDALRDDVDAVVICTAPDSHVALASQALAAGKAVLLEKPAALDLASLQRLLLVAETAPVPLLVGQTARFQPAHLALRRALDAGRIGAPRLLHLTWHTGHVWPGGWRAWQLDERRSGGQVVHNGVHALDLANSLLGGHPRRVFARELRSWSAGMPTPDSFHVLVEYDSGALATIELSYALRRRGAMLRRVLLAGTEGSVVVDTQDEAESDTDPVLAPAGIEGAMEHQYAHFREVLAGTAAPATTPDQIRDTLAAALAARRSCRTGNPEPVGA
ncbi:Gfo/Idh/MocA family oxidoreductase [Acidiferrimicrobium sp. IK]|uniref:Gfo/Idh/MocA family protein n=1 Tax=Acidiferrimicrobium sp. IK TaxID=2871700 RepID=UPI0021CB7D0B|nr:Gfo/Idh/MocA family oxidoreductase [Acidiferrimicrobium sp. IK]MCU4183326.1 Gfo/Idh/MocA family oxidoreductase [Acidiferrimicrobium sp. IK]